MKFTARHILLACCFLLPAMGITDRALARDIADLESRIESYVPDPRYHDDAVGLLVVREALVSLKEGSGGIGACLVNGATGEVVERGRNRQYTPYFRSDMHAEMDLLNRYEDRVKKKGFDKSGVNPRECGNLLLVSSVEPCPMCLTRIINSGIRQMIYIAPDDRGGMVQHMDMLPEFWKKFAAGRDFRQADCSPALRKLAEELFSHSMRDVPGRRTVQKEQEHNH
ncbi:MAG: nucleoside deaminase [Syntrophotaleaceae bacterium]